MNSCGSPIVRSPTGPTMGGSCHGGTHPQPSAATAREASTTSGFFGTRARRCRTAVWRRPHRSRCQEHRGFRPERIRHGDRYSKQALLRQLHRPARGAITALERPGVASGSRLPDAERKPAVAVLTRVGSASNGRSGDGQPNLPRAFLAAKRDSTVVACRGMSWSHHRVPARGRHHRPATC
jgi:hypothetical protein